MELSTLASGMTSVRTASNRLLDAIYSIPHTRSRFLRLGPILSGHHRYTYRGVLTRKSPFDLALYQLLIQAVRPDLILEIGTNHGGGALYLADLLALTGRGVVHTIDINDHGLPQVVTDHPRIQTFLCGWTGYDIEQTETFEKILVIDDGSHDYHDVIGALRRFGPLVSPGSYFVVEDAILDSLGWSRKYGGGPTRAIREFLRESTHFSIDREYCDFFGRNTTFSPNGFLRRDFTT